MRSNERGESVPPRGEGLRATLRTLLLGSPRGGRRWGYLTALALALFAVTFLAYEFGVFYHSGDVVLLPFHAAIVGGTAAFWAGYGRKGLVAGWALSSLPLLGMQVEWATDISPRPLIDRVAYVVQPDGLLVLATIGLAVAAAGFAAGAFAQKCIDAL
jgi:hypothetical protein